MSKDSLTELKAKVLEWYGAESPITKQFNSLCDNKDTPVHIREHLAHIIYDDLRPQ